MYYNINSRDSPSVLFKTTVRETEYDTLEEAYRFKNTQWEFASNYIFTEVINKHENSMDSFVRKFLAASSGISAFSILNANMLELIAPKQIADGGEIDVRALTKNFFFFIFFIIIIINLHKKYRLKGKF
jgi:hypothetical protein